MNLPPASASSSASPSPPRPSISPTSRQFVRLKKKAALLRDLLGIVDDVVFVQLAAIYYLDTLTILYLFRNLTQRAVTIPFTPTLLNTQSNRLPSFVHATISRYRAQYGDSSGAASSSGAFLASLARHTNHQLALLLGVSMLSMLLHLFLAAPSAGEASRGYLHGGILIDLVGQRAAGGAWSRVRVLALDLIVAFLQIVAVCVSAEAQRAEYACSSQDGAGRDNEEMAQLDALIERIVRGMRESEDQHPAHRPPRRQRAEQAQPEDGVELHDLDAHGREQTLQQQQEQQHPSPNDAENTRRDTEQGPSDALLDKGHEKDLEDDIEDLESGQAVLLTVDIVTALRNCFWDLKRRSERRGEV